MFPRSDLAKHERSKLAPHTSNKIAHHGETLVRSKTGKLLGDIIHLNSNHKLKDCRDLYPDVRRYLEISAQCVGRIIARYVTEDGKQFEDYLGTGFAVSNNTVMTAQHVVKDFHMDNGTKYHLSEIYITFQVNAEYDGEVFIGHKSMYKLEKFPNYIDQHPDLAEIAYSIQTVPWDSQHDFTFLKLTNVSQSFDFYLLPSILKPIDTTSTDCFVIGYPGTVSIEKCKQEYFIESVDEKSAEDFYYFICAKMNNFEKKVICSGKCVFSSDNFITHQCSTMRGTSGSPFILAEQTSSQGDELYFYGVHVGGDAKIYNNVVIPVDRVEFCVAYFFAIQNQQKFIEKHANHLQQYASGFRDELALHCPKVVTTLFG